MSKSSLSVLAKAISSKNGLTPAEAERFIQKMFEVANDAINEDKQLKVRWLGTFKVTAVKDRESVDVNTGDRIVIEGRDKISFTPDNILKEIINKPFAQFETVVVNDGVDFSDIDEKFAKMEEGESAQKQVEPVEDSEASAKSAVTAAETVAVENPAETASEISTVDNPTDTSSTDPNVSISAESSELLSKLDGSFVENSAEDLVAKIENSVVDEKLADENQTGDNGTESNILTEKSLSENSQDGDSQIEDSQVEDLQVEASQVEASQVETSLVEDVQEEVSLANERISEENQTSKSLPEESLVDDGDSNLSKSFAENVGSTSNQEEGGAVAAPHHNEDEEVEEDEDNSNRNHFVIPKYLVAIVCLAFVALLGGMGWFAFNYGKMQAQRDHLATQLEGMKTQVATQAKKPTPVPVKVDSTQLALNEKARQDSIRMAAASQAVEKAEESQKNEEMERAEAAKASKADDATKAKTSKTDDANKATSSHYDNDPRVRTGAYRIVGVAQVVTVKAGQSLAGLSKTYLGPGMECYMEAVNGVSEVKAGQKVKIPKLELKKKK